MKKLIYFFLVFGLFACSSGSEDDQNIQKSLFTSLSSDKTGITFTNTSIETPERNGGHYDYFYNGSGVAIVDLSLIHI